MPRRRLLFLGEGRVRSSPLKTWADALERVGFQCIFVDLKNISGKKLAKYAKRSSAAIFQGYGIVDHFVLRQLSILILLGVPIVRKWSGTDVYRGLKDEAVHQSIMKLDKLVAMNITSEHEGLVEELKELGLTRIQLTPQVASQKLEWSMPHSYFVPKTLLIYLPSSRYEFYRQDLMREVVKANSDLRFFVVADEQHSLRRFPNVRSLGWVDGLSTVWNQVGAMVRVTEHDGFSRSVVEALYMGKYVIHNHRLPGCWHADSLETINQCLVKFRKLSGPNTLGRKELRAYLGDHPENDLAEKILGVSLTRKEFWSAAKKIATYALGWKS